MKPPSRPTRRSQVQGFVALYGTGLRAWLRRRRLSRLLDVEVTVRRHDQEHYAAITIYMIS
jgi:hypothetical protein